MTGFLTHPIKDWTATNSKIAWRFISHQENYVLLDIAGFRYNNILWYCTTAQKYFKNDEWKKCIG